MFENKLINLEPLFNDIDDSYSENGNMHDLEKILFNFFLSKNLKQQDIGEMFNISTRTVRNKIKEYELGTTV